MELKLCGDFSSLSCLIYWSQFYSVTVGMYLFFLYIHVLEPNRGNICFTAVLTAPDLHTYTRTHTNTNTHVHPQAGLSQWLGQPEEECYYTKHKCIEASEHRPTHTHTDTDSLSSSHPHPVTTTVQFVLHPSVPAIRTCSDSCSGIKIYQSHFLSILI